MVQVYVFLRQDWQSYLTKREKQVLWCHGDMQPIFLCFHFESVYQSSVPGLCQSDVTFLGGLLHGAAPCPPATYCSQCSVPEFIMSKGSWPVAPSTGKILQKHAFHLPSVAMATSNSPVNACTTFELKLFRTWKKKKGFVICIIVLLQIMKTFSCETVTGFKFY